MTQKTRVLVWPGLTELGYEIVASLKPLRFYEVYCASSKEVTLETQICDGHSLLPDVSDSNALAALQTLVRDQGIDVIYPAHDEIIVFCRNHADSLPGLTVIAPPMDVANTLRSKHQTYAALIGKILVPDVYHSVADVLNFPVFAKPDRGQGSQGVRKITSRAELEALTAEVPAFFKSNVVAEFLPGREYTIDCLSQANGELVFAAARIRHQIRNGISTDAEIVDLPDLSEIAATIGAEFSLTGAWFFQLKHAQDGRLKLLEVAPRLGGASCLNRMRGVNFAHLSILAATGKPFAVMPRHDPRRIQRRLANYPVQQLTSLDAIYVDFDDCLWQDPLLNTGLLAILYRHMDLGARIVLISRHAGDLAAKLEGLRITALFDAVYHLTDAAVLKSEIIKQDLADNFGKTSPRAVFIDDSFRERKDVAETLHLEALDLTMLEAVS